MHHGSCLCGAVTFTIKGDLGPGSACHCQQCRQWTGHFLADTEIQLSDLSIADEAELKWYHSSAKVRRGFCGVCGSALFFDPLDKQKHSWIGVALGSITTPTQVNIETHIFVAEKGDYYDINDNAQQHQN